MALTLNLEPWFKVTAHTLPKGTLWVKYEPDWPKGENIYTTQVILDGWTDAEMD